jgi:hypothetical protein
MQENKTAISNQDSKSIFCSESTHKKMKELLSAFDMPKWIVSDSHGTMRKCKYCGSSLDNESVRGIGVCLNAQHFGDIQVEILCNHCLTSYFYNFKKMCANTSAFCEALNKDEVNTEPVLLSDIKPSENNLADLLIEDEQKRVKADEQ